MRVPYRITFAGLSCGFAMLLAAIAAGAEAEEEGTTNPVVARVEKQLQSIQSRLNALQEQEMQLAMQIMQFQQKANEGLKEPNKAAEQLAKGAASKELREYKNLLLQCAKIQQGLDTKLYPLLKSAKGLQRDRSAVPDVYKAQIDAVTQRIESKHKTNLEKVALFYEQTAEYRAALGIYSKVYNELPKKDRDKDAALTEKMGSLYEKSGDFRSALAFYKRLLDQRNPKERYSDRRIAEKVAQMYEKCGDIRSALSVYRAALETIPADKRDSDGKGIRDKIREIEKKTRR